MEDCKESCVKRFLISALILLLISCGLYCYYQVPRHVAPVFSTRIDGKAPHELPIGKVATPRLRLEPSAVDFGNRWIGDTCRMNVVLTNDSLRDIRIRKVSSSCGCLSTFADEFVLASGERREVSIEVDTARKEAGVFNGRITLSADTGADALASEIPVTVNLAHRSLVTCEPSAISLGHMLASQPVKFSLKCRCEGQDNSGSQQNWKVETAPWLKITMVHELANEAEIECEGFAPKKTGSLTDVVSVTRNGRKVDVSVNGFVTGIVAFDAGQIVHVIKSGETGFERSVRLSHVKGGDFELRSISYEGPFAKSFQVTTRQVLKSEQSIRLTFNSELAETTRVVKGVLAASCLVDGDELNVTLPVIVVRR